MQSKVNYFNCLSSYTAVTKGEGFVFDTDEGSHELDIDQVKILADKGDPDGTYALGAAYLFGWGIEQDPEKGIELLEKASDLEQPEAMTLLVRLYMAKEYSMEIERAIEYSKKGAEAGISDAELFMGIAYMDGICADQDFDKAAEMFRRSAKQGNTEARNSLAYLYQEGLGVEKDLNKAFKLYKNAASAGNANSQFQVGTCYRLGIGVKEDIEAAAEWYKKAAEQGDAESMEMLGLLYLGGSDGLSVDLELSFDYFLNAALKGMMNSMMIVGKFYIEGIVVEKDIEEGLKWIRLAASSGYVPAKELLDEYNKEGI